MTHDPWGSLKDSISLDAAYLNGGVPGVIDRMAEEAMDCLAEEATEEMENATNRDPSAAGNAATLPGTDSRADVTGGLHSQEHRAT